MKNRVGKEQHCGTGNTPPPGLSAVAVAAAGCTLGSRRGGRTGPWGHGIGLQIDGTLDLFFQQLQGLCESPVGEKDHNMS